MKKHSIAGTVMGAIFMAILLLNREKANAMPDAKPALNYYYFRYTGTDFTAQGYLVAGNWIARGSSPGSPCADGADEAPCVIYACLPYGCNKVNDLMLFLNNLGSGHAEEYVENPNHIVYYQPEP